MTRKDNNAAGDSEGWSLTTVASQVDSNGQVWTLVCADDGEWFWSYIYHHVDLRQRGQLIYETEGWLTSLWRSPKNSLFAVDDDGILHSNENGKWNTVDLGATEGLNFIWGFDEKNLYTCGAGGMVLGSLGASWGPIGRKLSGQLFSMHGLMPNQIYVTGNEGQLHLFDGKTFRRLHPPTNSDLHSVMVLKEDQVYICGNDGSFIVGARDQWQMFASLDCNLLDLAWYGEHVHIAAGERGLYVFDGMDLVPIREDLDVAGLACSGQYLSAVGGATVYRFDGQTWTSHTFSF